MKNFTLFGALVVAILGVALLVFGILFVSKAGSTKQDLATAIQPLKLEEVDATYQAAKTKMKELATAEEPQIQAGKAAPSVMYTYLTVQTASLGLVLTNIGVTDFVATIGIINIVAGLGMILAGLGLFIVFQILPKLASVLATLAPSPAAQS
ncbi:MAG: hypothetical protein EPO21_00780 [Chloroflexota bacterium]|nr:MAG: hypothetical protein EPO21_00780 [Chloroflexota bacterium]